MLLTICIATHMLLTRYVAYHMFPYILAHSRITGRGDLMSGVGTQEGVFRALASDPTLLAMGSKRMP